MIGDMLNGCGSATGVDNSQERSGACRNVLRKYAVPCCRLFRGDATTFAAPPPDLSKTQVVTLHHTNTSASQHCRLFSE